MSGSTLEFLGSLTPIVAIALVFVAVVISAQRFVKRREREGEWDKNGPRHPTEPPARFLRLPGYFSERPEIVTEDEPEPPDEKEPKKH
ncbi:MAG TPA: hypothetical protein VGI97_01585 [Gemmatimonadaceae bacterium]|jgi:hypothetical protein